MGKKEYEGLPLYKFTHAQDVDMMQFRFSLHKSVLHVPSCMIVDHPLDWSLLERALNIEIERNDCMRLHFVKTKEGLKQYYLPEYSVSNIPIDDYRGMEEEEAKKLLHKRGSKPVLDFMHGEVFRVRFFRSFDGRYGVYLCACHLIMDLAAEFLFYKDLFSVYDALESGKELPKPLGSSEELLKRDLDRQANVQKREKDEKFFREFFSLERPITYVGIDGTDRLEKRRKKEKNPSLRNINVPIILFDKTETITCTIDADLTSKMYALLEKENISLGALFHLAYRTYLSSINYRLKDIYLPFIVDRRSTLLETNCGGTRATSLPLLTSIEEDCSFKDALAEVSKTMMKLFVHTDFPFVEANKIIYEKMNVKNLSDQMAPMNFSCMPSVPYPEELEDWNFDFSGFSNGHFPMLCYIIAVPNAHTGEISVYYEYNTRFVPKEAIIKMHEGILKVFEEGTNNPDVTIGELMDSL